MTAPLTTKLGVKGGMRAILVDAPADVVDALSSTRLDVATKLDGRFDYIHCFVRTQQDLEEVFSSLKEHLEPTGMLWVSWPKGKKLGSDLTLPRIIKIGYDRGLVESKCVSVDPVWSGLKFTVPKEGKIYNNSYGQLKR